MMPPLLGLGVVIHSLLNRLIDWYLAKGRSAGPLYTELAIKVAGTRLGALAQAPASHTSTVHHTLYS